MIRGAPQVRVIPITEAVARCAALTGREAEVLSLKSHGFTNKEICRHFDIEIKTVECHMTRVLQKLGARNAPAATAIAAKGGLV